MAIHHQPTYLAFNLLGIHCCSQSSFYRTVPSGDKLLTSEVQNVKRVALWSFTYLLEQSQKNLMHTRQPTRPCISIWRIIYDVIQKLQLNCLRCPLLLTFGPCLSKIRLGWRSIFPSPYMATAACEVIDDALGRSYSVQHNAFFDFISILSPWGLSQSGNMSHWSAVAPLKDHLFIWSFACLFICLLDCYIVLSHATHRALGQTWLEQTW